MIPLATRDLTSALIAMLQTATARPVGDGEVPQGFTIEQGYYIVYGIPNDGYFDGLEAAGQDADVVYQVTSVGKRRDHADWLADRARLTILARTGPTFQVAFVPPAGMKVIDRRPDSGLPGTPVSQGTPPNQRWQVAERFVLSVTSS